MHWEIRPSGAHNMLLRLIRRPLRLQRRYHAYPFLRSVSTVVYICMPNANEAAVCHWCDQDLPTHHMVAENGPLTSHFDSPGRLYGYSNATMTINRCEARQSSSTYVCQTQMGHERRVEPIRTFPHTIWWRRVDPPPPTSTHQDASMAIATQP